MSLYPKSFELQEGGKRDKTGRRLSLAVVLKTGGTTIPKRLCEDPHSRDSAKIRRFGIIGAKPKAAGRRDNP